MQPLCTLGEFMKLLFVSLGCDKNLVDSEDMLGVLTRAGHEIVDDENEAEAIIINTCCFIHDAKEESVETILEMAEYKKAGTCKVLIVTGCMAQRYKQEIIEEIPEVDAVLGTTSYGEILKAVEEAVAGRHYQEYRDIDYLVPDQGKRVLTTGGHFAYLKIAEGCDKHCTYCIIPKLRGKFRSVPMERLVRQAEDLAAQGVKELILVAQETTLYGKDLYGEKSLHRLLKELCKIKGIRWIRILYCYPEEIYDELIQTMKEEPKICHYLDLPIQHASDAVLKRMGRRTTRKELTEKVQKLRKEIPDIVLRTTLITGFPGETEEDHETLMEFVDEMEFDRLGVFTYSAEEDTPAASMEGQIQEEVKEERRDALMELQQEVSYDKGTERIGQELLVMIEGKVSGESAYIARTYGDAPKVDGYIFVQTGELLVTGDFAKVRVTGAMEYDLIGVLADEYTE
ncbi:Ribosomal protein S12 methylthiotransferase RimO [uncultured Blautia sp.]